MTHTNYEALTESERWATFVEEWGLPSVRAYLRTRWEQHVQRSNNGDNITGVWHNGYDSKPYWSADRDFNLTNWGLGISVSADVWDERRHAVIHMGPWSLSLSRSEKGV